MIDSDSEDFEAGEISDSDVDNGAYGGYIEIQTLSNHINNYVSSACILMLNDYILVYDTVGSITFLNSIELQHW